MMKTFAERYKESIVNLSKEELIQQRDIILNHIEAQRERLHIVSNEKKVHDIRVAIKRANIKLREIDSLLKNLCSSEDSSIYHLLDSRISRFINEIVEDPNFVIPNWSKYILLSGTAEEVCESANNGEYGELCVVADSKGQIMWEWNGDNGWGMSD